jgi:hypothetical protein
MICSSQGRYLHTGQYKQNKHRQMSMPWMEFEPRIPMFERAKMVRTLDLAITVIDLVFPKKVKR